MLEPASVPELNPYNRSSLIYFDSIYIKGNINVSKSFKLKRILNKRVIFRGRDRIITT